MDLDADIAVMLTDFGEDVTFEGSTFKGIVDIEDGTILAEDGSRPNGRTLSVEVRDSDVPGIKRGSTITMRSATWKVRDYERSGDGRVVMLFLGS